jgi:fatty-acid peroxygenase
MSTFPKDPLPDSTLALYLEGYEFISNRCARFGADVFETRLLLRKTICMRGQAAARLFYDPTRFVRHGAFPRRGLKSFLGNGGVQTLDGRAHHNRKMMFMRLMTPESIKRLTSATARYWRDYAGKWEGLTHVVLYDEAAEILCRAVCDWAGVPLAEKDVPSRTKDFLAMIESPAALGPRYWRGKRARKRAEQWIARIIDDIRDNKLSVDPESAAFTVAAHRELNGELLSSKIAAVELINLVRPAVAVALYIVFIAHAIHEHSDMLHRLRARPDYADLFVQEVRRFYPFFPTVAALVRSEFVRNGLRFEKGTWVLLDLYGTNHDPKSWSNPGQFTPERFENRAPSNYDFIPQGGDGYQSHRCAGEWITLELMKQAVRFLTEEIEYEVPRQDLTIALSRVPAIPASRFVISGVRNRQSQRRRRSLMQPGVEATLGSS